MDESKWTQKALETGIANAKTNGTQPAWVGKKTLAVLTPVRKKLAQESNQLFKTLKPKSERELASPEGDDDALDAEPRDRAGGEEAVDEAEPAGDMVFTKGDAVLIVTRMESGKLTPLGAGRVDLLQGTVIFVAVYAVLEKGFDVLLESSDCRFTRWGEVARTIDDDYSDAGKARTNKACTHILSLPKTALRLVGEVRLYSAGGMPGPCLSLTAVTSLRTKSSSDASTTSSARTPASSNSARRRQPSSGRPPGQSRLWPRSAAAERVRGERRRRPRAPRRQRLRLQRQQRWPWRTTRRAAMRMRRHAHERGWTVMISLSFVFVIPSVLSVFLI